MEWATDSDVAAVFQKGHPEALALIYQRYGPLVYTIALRSLGDAADAEDIVPQAFVSAWRRRDSFDPERGGLAAWLTVITRNKVTDVFRSRQREAGALRAAAAGPQGTFGQAIAVEQVIDRVVLSDELALLVVSSVGPSGVRLPECGA